MRRSTRLTPGGEFCILYVGKQVGVKGTAFFGRVSVTTSLTIVYPAGTGLFILNERGISK